MNAIKTTLVVIVLMCLCLGAGYLWGSKAASGGPSSTIAELAQRDQSISTGIIKAITDGFGAKTTSDRLANEVDRLTEANKRLEDGLKDLVGSIESAYAGASTIADRSQRINAIAESINKAVEKLLKTIDDMERNDNNTRNSSGS